MHENYGVDTWCLTFKMLYLQKYAFPTLFIGG